MEAWKILPNKQTYMLTFSFGLALFLSSLLLTIHYVPLFETRAGFVPYDPFMTYLPAVDVSPFVFFLLYGSIILGSFYFFKDPKLLMMVIYSFGIMYWVRALCITLVPLNEPALLIPLSDPFIEKLGIYQTFIKRDLFFSGHFASVFIPYLVLRKTQFHWVFLSASIAIGFLVMIQHIHYSYDVIGGAVFTYLSVYLAEKIIGKFNI